MALLIRDWRIMVAQMIQVELIEQTCGEVFSIYKECWWNMVVLDIILSNTPGMLLGLAFKNLLGVCDDCNGLESYDIGGASGKSFTQWGMWSCHRKFGNFVYLLALMHVHF